VVRRLKAAGIKIVSVIPTVEHARRMEEEGVDAVVASGSEAGGHVGTVSTLPLVPQVVDAVKIGSSTFQVDWNSSPRGAAMR
jgi:enoyl-[acyl-carrier protein] reductase II